MEIPPHPAQLLIDSLGKLVDPAEHVILCDLYGLTGWPGSPTIPASAFTPVMALEQAILEQAMIRERRRTAETHGITVQRIRKIEQKIRKISEGEIQAARSSLRKCLKLAARTSPLPARLASRLIAAGDGRCTQAPRPDIVGLIALAGLLGMTTGISLVLPPLSHPDEFWIRSAASLRNQVTPGESRYLTALDHPIGCIDDFTSDGRECTTLKRVLDANEATVWLDNEQRWFWDSRNPLTKHPVGKAIQKVLSITAPAEAGNVKRAILSATAADQSFPPDTVIRSLLERLPWCMINPDGTVSPSANLDLAGSLTKSEKWVAAILASKPGPMALSEILKRAADAGVLHQTRRTLRQSPIVDKPARGLYRLIGRQADQPPPRNPQTKQPDPNYQIEWISESVVSITRTVTVKMLADATFPLPRSIASLIMGAYTVLCGDSTMTATVGDLGYVLSFGAITKQTGAKVGDVMTLAIDVDAMRITPSVRSPTPTSGSRAPAITGALELAPSEHLTA